MLQYFTLKKFASKQALNLSQKVRKAVCKNAKSASGHKLMSIPDPPKPTCPYIVRGTETKNRAHANADAVGEKNGGVRGRGGGGGRRRRANAAVGGPRGAPGRLPPRCGVRRRGHVRQGLRLAAQHHHRPQRRRAAPPRLGAAPRDAAPLRQQPHVHVRMPYPPHSSPFP